MSIITHTTPELAKVASELQALQRHRTWYLKSRNMVANRLQATVAGHLGYSSKMEDKDRKAKFKEASELIDRIEKREEIHPALNTLVLTTLQAVNGFDAQKMAMEKEMKTLASSLQIAQWVSQPEQRGFGVLFAAIVLGESGDLHNYATPGKLWRRFGCAPYEFDGKCLMGATWRSGKEGKLPAEEWEKFGYNPRRRSIAYLIGDNMVKQNQTKDKETKQILWVGPYRKRYEETKTLFRFRHQEYTDLRCHRHGMLLATKLLLKNLWIEWTGRYDGGWGSEDYVAWNSPQAVAI